MDARHGGNIYEIERTRHIGREQLADYSANINPLGPPLGAENAVKTAFLQMSRYPDIAYGDLRKAIADYEGVPEEAILPGNGAADVLFGIGRALRPKQAAIISPAFSEYRQACQAVGCAVTEVLLSKSADFLPDKNLPDRIPAGTDLVFLCTPNNPTGAVCPRSVIRVLAEQAQSRGGSLLVDESFLDFREDEPDFTAIPLCREYKNLIVLKSLTKFYAMAGVRIGYAVSDSPELAEEYRRVSPPWMVSTFAEQLTIAALQDKEYRRQTQREVSRWAAALYEGLDALPGIRAYQPGANFILFEVENCESGFDLKEELLRHDILIRRCGDFAGLGENWYRTCVKTPEKNEYLLQTLREILRTK